MYPENPYEYLEHAWSDAARAIFKLEVDSNVEIVRLCEGDGVEWHFVKLNGTLGKVDGVVTHVDDIAGEIQVTFYKKGPFLRGEVHIFNRQNGVAQNGPIDGWIVTKSSVQEIFVDRGYFME